MLYGLKKFGKITEIAYRRDGHAYLLLTLTRASGNWQVRMANYFGDARNPATLYLPPGGQLNELTSVFNATVNWPALPSTLAPPEKFLVRFKLARPFTYLGLGLAIDHFSYASTGRSFGYAVDAVRKNLDAGKWSPYGVSCALSENRGYAIPSNPGNQRPLELVLFGGPQNSAAVGVLGGSNTKWGPLKLPFDLSPFGMTGCSVLASQDILLPTTTLSTGGAKLTFLIPKDPRLAGLRLFAQWMVIDATKKVPLRFSNGMDITLGTSIGNHGGPQAALLYGVGGVARSTRGFLAPGVALVTEFTQL